MDIVVYHYRRRVSERQALNRGCLEGLYVIMTYALTSYGSWTSYGFWTSNLVHRS